MDLEREELVKKILPLLQAARRYHRHEVVGMEHLPKAGRALIVVNHSLATYDIALLMTAIYEDMGRMARPLVDRLFFKIPYLGDLMKLFGAAQGSPETAERLLNDDEIVTVAPGGMREALRPSRDRYQILWDRRLGFIRLAMKTRAPVILAACPKADDLYEIYPSHLTSWFYQTFRVPIFFARGVGPTPLPRPVKLVHYLSESLLPPAWTDDAEALEARAAKFHDQVVQRMHDLMGDALEHPDQ